jgi:peptide/nickel transport system substrate-binding protein
MSQVLSRPWFRERLAVMAVVLAVLAAACGGGSGSGASPGARTSGGETDETTLEARRGGKLLYGLEGETDSYDPSAAQWNASSWLVASAIFDPLVYYTDELELVPFLAESFEPNEDHTVWTITTREGVTFHNGEVFDAHALMANIEAQQASPLVSTTLGPVLEVEVTSDRTVEFTIAAPWVHFPHLFVGQLGMMMAPAMIDDDDGGNNPIGTGPFAFSQWTRSSSLNVERFDDYWLAEPYLNEIEFRPVEDPFQRVNAMRAGDLDVAMFSSSPEAVTDQPPGTNILSGSLGEDRETFLMFNQLRPPFDDVRVREALVRATDADQFVEVIGNGHYERARGIFGPSSPWHVETEYPDHDPTGARALIDDVEAELGAPLEVEILGPSWPIVLRGGQLLLEQWSNLDIEAKLETVELTQFIARVVSGNYDVAIFQFHGASHPDGEFVFLHSQYAAPEGELGLNFARNVNYTIDEALVEARATEDEARLRELYGIVQTEMARDLPYLFLWHLNDMLLIRDNVHDLTDWTLPDGAAGADILQSRHRFHQIWVD